MRTEASRTLSRLALMLTIVGGFALPAVAQESRLPEGTPLPDYAKVYLDADGRVGGRVDLVENGLFNVMITGYWPPSNEMVRHFSNSPVQNPDGWVGENWEGRGYNVYAFFPEFPEGMGRGEGDFEVDYQDTSVDFWAITDLVHPVGLISTGRTDAGAYYWEIEQKQRNLDDGAWQADYLDPRQPTPAPPDDSEGVGFVRYFSLPWMQMLDDLEDAELGIDPFVDGGFAGGFVCEFIAYHVCWYHDLHAEPDDPQRNVSAGHIHVGYMVDLADAIAATEITLRALIEDLDDELVSPGDMNCDDFLDFFDIDGFVQAMNGFDDYYAMYPTCNWRNADCNDDGSVDFLDIDAFVALLTGV